MAPVASHRDAEVRSLSWGSVEWQSQSVWQILEASRVVMKNTEGLWPPVRREEEKCLKIFLLCSKLVLDVEQCIRLPRFANKASTVMVKTCQRFQGKYWSAWSYSSGQRSTLLSRLGKDGHKLFEACLGKDGLKLFEIFTYTSTNEQILGRKIPYLTGKPMTQN